MSGLSSYYIYWLVADGVNLALNKPTWHKTAHESLWHSGNAVDGIYDPTAGSNSCYLSLDGDDYPTWAVDLGGSTLISHIVLLSRDCCGQLDDFEIYVSDTRWPPVSYPLSDLPDFHLCAR